MGSMAPTKDVHLLMCSVPAYGHTRALRGLARQLSVLGYPITFITGNCFRKSIEAIEGVEFVPLAGVADFDLELLDEYFPDRKNFPNGPERVFHDMEHVFLRPIPDQHNAVQSVLTRPELQDKKVVILADAAFGGILPILLEAPGVRRVPVLGLGSFPLMMLSIDTAPFGPGLPSQGEEVNKAMNAKTIEMFSGVYNTMVEVIAPYDCAKQLPHKAPFDNWFYLPDLYLQLSIPSMEPPRRDLPSNIRYIGSVPGNNDKKPLPSWYQEFVADDNTGRPLILVSQGTVACDTSDELINPTIEACKELNVRLVVCGVHLNRPADEDLPSNVRWTDWIAFEQIFPHTSIVVTNGGYGGICQAFEAGIPMVVSGTTEDKTETTLRAEMTGAAINLRSQNPSAESIKNALSKVLADSSFKTKAMGLKKEFSTFDSLKSVMTYVDEVAEKFFP